jgi:hypothetical protein
MKHKVIDVHHGSTSESWLVVYEDGRIQFHLENDGARFLRCGAEAINRGITLADVEAHYGRQIEQVRAALTEFGQQ